MKPLLFAVVAAFASLIGACTTQNQTDTTTPVLSGPPNTTFPIPPANSAEMGWVSGDGTRSRIADYRGKVLVLDFYATWCEPCRRSIPHLMTLQENFEAKGLQVV